MKADTEYWENPHMFMTSGPHGPFYKLHSFRATGPLDSENIKGLKIAGTLKYEVVLYILQLWFSPYNVFYLL